MPLQNRVTPFNKLEAAAERGTLMGNRGILHDIDKRIGTTTWKHKRWLTCVLAFKGRKRPLMAPGRYTELFFLDEATSLAAGHRPCRECRKADYERFIAAWRETDDNGGRQAIANEIDAALHLNRLGPGRRQARFRCNVSDLPNGGFLTEVDHPDEAWLLWNGALHRWSHGGYVEKRAPKGGSEVEVLTPSRIVDVLRAGYVPSVKVDAK